MQRIFNVLLALSLFSQVKPQELVQFNMGDHAPLFVKLVKIKPYYKNRSDVNNKEKQRVMTLLSDKYSLNSKSPDLEKMFYELHVNPRCHKFLKNIDSNTWKSELKKKGPVNSFSDMEPWSGKLFYHVANLNLKDLTLTKERYDIDIAMVLKKPSSLEYLYYLPKCADTPLPFNFIN